MKSRGVLLVSAFSLVSLGIGAQTPEKIDTAAYAKIRDEGLNAMLPRKN